MGQGIFREALGSRAPAESVCSHAAAYDQRKQPGLGADDEIEVISVCTADTHTHTTNRRPCSYRAENEIVFFGHRLNPAPLFPRPPFLALMEVEGRVLWLLDTLKQSAQAW